MQIPIRHPVEHAHRVQTVNLLSNGRLRFGVGTGSTRDDFEAVQADYDTRFKVLPEHAGSDAPHLERRTGLWPGAVATGQAPRADRRCLLGAWRSPRWINLAAQHCQGWIASGIHGSWEDAEVGLRMYREAGGQRAIIANIFTDLRPEPQIPGG